jgi:hypothetical protein
MKRFNLQNTYLLFILILGAFFITGCGGGGDTASTPLSTAKATTALSLAGNAGTIDEPAKTIAVTVPFGTNVTALVGTFTTTGTGVTVAGVPQVSGITANNFTAPVTFRVTAADGTFVDYVVTVTVAPNFAKAITAFSFAAFTHSVGTIDEAAKTIAVSVLPGTNVTALVATFTTTGAGVKVGLVPQVSATTANDFTAPVTYRVTAADATFVDYVVTVTAGLGPVPVPLGTAGNFAILTKAGITDVPASAITGNVGTSPITGAAIGLGCAEVTGTIYTVDAAGPACRVVDAALLTTAVSDMENAYTVGAGRPAGVGAFLNTGAGILTNRTLVPGTYTFNAASSNVTIPTNLTLNGGANDVWIFQIAGTLDISGAMQVLLTGTPGNLPQAKNIFWVVAGAVTLNLNSHFEGVILAATNIAPVTGASINGRLLAQTAVTLQSNTVTQPAP